MLARMKYNLFSRRSLSVGFGFVLFALIVGIYFLFRPFPTGPSLDVKADSPSIASVSNFDGYVRAPGAAKTGAFFSDKYAYVRAPGAKQAVANAPGAIGNVEAATVNRWYEYANPPSEVRTNPVQLPQVAAAPNQKVSPGQGSSKGFLLGGKLLQPSASAVQRVDIGGGYVLENSTQGSEIVAPVNLTLASQALESEAMPAIVLELSSEDQRGFAPDKADSDSTVQRLDIGGGYMLEMSAQGNRIVASVSHPQAGVPRISTDFVQRIDIGGGYVLEVGSLSSRIITPVTLQP